jgi:hypothetical protein
MSLVPFDAFVDPSGRLGPLLRFSSGPAGGLPARREPTWIHSGAAGVDAGAGAGAASVSARAKSKIKVLFAYIGSLAPTWYQTSCVLYASCVATVCFLHPRHSLA